MVGVNAAFGRLNVGCSLTGKLNFVLKILKSHLTAVLFVVMFITALLAVCAGVIIGGFFELGKAVANPSAKYTKATPLVDLELAKR
jgi:hypothetical protein